MRAYMHVFVNYSSVSRVCICHSVCMYACVCVCVFVRVCVRARVLTRCACVLLAIFIISIQQDRNCQICSDVFVDVIFCLCLFIVKRITEGKQKYQSSVSLTSTFHSFKTCQSSFPHQLF